MNSNCTVRGYGLRLKSAMEYAGDRIEIKHQEDPKKDLQQIVKEVLAAFSSEQQTKYDKLFKSKDTEGAYQKKLNSFLEMANEHFEGIVRELNNSNTETPSSFLRPDQRA